MKAIIKKSYLIGILLIVLISVSLIIQYSYLNNINIRDKEINIEKSREILGQEITSELRLNSQVILSAYEIVSMNSWSEIELEKYFKRIMEVNPTFSAIYYGDINGKLINSSDWSPPGDYNVQSRPWYIKAVEEGDIVYSDAYIDALTNEIIITISKPIYSEDNQLKGVVSGDISIQEIIDLVENTRSASIGYSFLIDGQGNILAHPNYKYDDYSKLRNIEEISNNILEEMKVKGLGEKEVTLDGVGGYLSYQPIDAIDWTIGSFASFDDYNKDENYLLKIFLITLLITIVIFAGFLWIQNKHFLKPLYLLEKHIGNINIEENIDYRMILDEKDPFLVPRNSINRALDKAEEYFRQQKQYQEELLSSHEELEASYGQLSAMEQELREQYKKLEKREKELYNLSYCDQLTGLYNRRFFVEELKRLDREENLPLTFIMADVNGLKLINDSFGHKAGDELLKVVGNAMKDSCTGDQTASRIGGDEFVIILPKIDTEQSEDIIKKIKKLAEENNPHNIELSISFGVETKYNKDYDISKVLRKVEEDMYSKKLLEGPSMRSKTIDTIVQALYEKNPREEAHSHRVSILCQEMGNYLGMTEEKIKELETVGLLHDIGKVAISDHVLEKPGALNNEEWEEMKRHPEIGYRILSTINEMSKISEYILAHHERYDGLGYPKGLKSEEIPIVSRIIAIADAYDAMISDRPYRKGLSKEIAIKEIIKNSGTQFDPVLAKIFIENVLKEEWTEEV